MLPEDKEKVVCERLRKRRRIAMAGDGVDDAPALARAHLSNATGAGSNVAIESTGPTLVRGHLRAVAKVRRLSHATMRNIRQNLLFAFNALGTPLAAGVLYPITDWLLSPIFATDGSSLSSVSVNGNALRLRAAKPWPMKTRSTSHAGRGVDNGNYVKRNLTRWRFVKRLQFSAEAQVIGRSASR